jgi:hypothetical protein
MTEPRYLKGTVALLVGCALNHFGDRLLGVKMELFYGLSTFSFAWILDVFFVPFVVGVVVSLIFGLGGKWLCYFPPLIVRSISYVEIAYLSGVPEGSHLNPFGWWGFFVILAMEAAAIGGVIGEFMIKDTYGSTRPPPEPENSAAMPADPEA